jgi:hypothetical protein
MTVRHPLHRRFAIVCLVVGMTGSDRLAAGADERIGATEAKAAFLFNVVKFVQWPGLPPNRLVIGVLAHDSFRRTLQGLVDRKILNGRSIVVRELRSEDDVQGCHIIFFDDASEAPRRGDIIRRVGEAGVLTIGETTTFLAEGGHIRLYVEMERLRFQIDPAGVELAGLKVSAQFMSLAR